jgi:transcriptional regulator with XRE-family HTH domain
MNVRQLVGENVRRIRLSRELSQEAVAERMGIDRAYVSALERGHRNPTIITLWLLAEALGVRLKDLFDESPSDHVRAGRRARRRQ